MIVDTSLPKLYITRRSDGTINIRTLCPYHNDKHPSLSVLVSGSKITFRCFAGCHIDDQRGSAIMGYLFSDERTRGIIEAHTVSRNNAINSDGHIEHDKLLSDFCEERCLRLDTAKRYGLRIVNHCSNGVFGLNPGQLGVYIPLHGISGKKSYQIRLLGGSEDRRGRFISEPGFKSEVLVCNESGDNTAVLCEGPIKALVLFDKLSQLGLNYCVYYTTGVSHWKSSDVLSSLVSHIQRSGVSRVIVAFDADDAGISTSKYVVKYLLSNRLRVYEADYDHISYTLASSGVAQRGIDDYVALLHRGGNLSVDNVVPVKRNINLVSASQIRSSLSGFVFDPILPIGSITILEGNPGCGKSYLTIGMALSVSTGKTLYLGENTLTPSRSGSVIMFTCEDAAATVKHRMTQIMCGHPIPNNIFCYFEPFDLRNSVVEVQDILDTYRPALVIIDPIMNYFNGDVDVYRDNAVRSVFSSYIRIAQQYGFALAVVRHLKKNADNVHAVARGIGSIAFSGLARCILSMDRSENGVVTLTSVKNSYAPVQLSMSYRIEDMRVLP